MLQWTVALFLKRGALRTRNVGSILLALSQFLIGGYKLFSPTRLEWINQTQKGYCVKSAYTK